MASLDALQKTLGHSFADEALLQRALRHASLNIDDDNEALEFIGDRVLGLAMAQILMTRYASEPEGALSRRLSQLVSGKSCAKIAKLWDLGAYIRTDSGIQSRRKIPNAVLADGCEAVLGAVFLDAGYEVAQKLVATHWAELLQMQGDVPIDSKTALQEFIAKHSQDFPTYEIVEQSGAAHAPHFTVSVSSTLGAAEGEGHSRKAAEQAAAQNLLTQLQEGRNA
ncbi:MAG: Ribonuclease 3 [Alphaproteobacteria bacterium]|nr:MAG: Ribonuclease 3 [Alphaproteobacteria bacterium]